MFQKVFSATVVCFVCFVLFLVLFLVVAFCCLKKKFQWAFPIVFQVIGVRLIPMIACVTLWVPSLVTMALTTTPVTAVPGMLAKTAL